MSIVVGKEFSLKPSNQLLEIKDIILNNPRRLEIIFFIFHGVIEQRIYSIQSLMYIPYTF